MLQAAACFGAGYHAAGPGLTACCEQHLPRFKLRDAAQDGGTTFRVSVRVHGAVVPELAEPGLVARPELRLEASLGHVQKQTEPAVFSGDGAKANSASSSTSSWGVAGWRAIECGPDEGYRDDGEGPRAVDADCTPWCFDDTLTFAATSSEVHGPGLALRLVVRNDLCLGPLQLRLPRVQDLGEAVLELREDVLSRCRPQANRSGAKTPARPTWETPEFPVFLARRAAEGAPLGARTALGSDGQRVPYVVVSCVVNVDPDSILFEAEDAQRSLVDKVVSPMVQCMQAQHGCRGLPLCRDRALAHCHEFRSPRSRPLCAGGVSPQRAARHAPGREDSYSTCEVPASLEGSAFTLWDGDDERTPVNGLWGARQCTIDDTCKDGVGQGSKQERTEARRRRLAKDGGHERWRDRPAPPPPLPSSTTTAASERHEPASRCGVQRRVSSSEGEQGEQLCTTGLRHVHATSS